MRTSEPDEIIVTDNLPAHEVAGIRELLEARGARLIYLPLYSSDLNPIEKCCSKVKTSFRTAMTCEEPEHASSEVLLMIAESDSLKVVQEL